MKLAVGTAQFGLAYGVANQDGQVGMREMEAILRRAAAAGVDTLDTALAYGDSEQRLGNAGVRTWKVVSKLPGRPVGSGNLADWVSTCVRGSLSRLQIPRLYGLLLHRPEQLLEPEGASIYRALVGLKGEGLVQKIGVSIYDPAELSALCSAYEFDLVQAPFNLLDRRLIHSGWLSRLAASGVEVHARSVFLQGLLVMPGSRRPKKFDRWAPLLERYTRWLDETGLTPLQACLRDALSVSDISRVLVGVDSLAQLEANLEAADGAPPPIPEWLATSDTDLLNPFRWGVLA